MSDSFESPFASGVIGGLALLTLAILARAYRESKTGIGLRPWVKWLLRIKGDPRLRF
jgi:hypothetical protein